MIWLICFCFIVCCGIAYYSYQNARENIIDSGAQYVVTVGVLFTFGGIAYGLYNFDTNVANMIDSINNFLDGMRLAFVTSIIGMSFGLGIKFLQKNVKPSEDTTNETLIKILAEVRSSNNSTFGRELGEFATAMKNLAPDLKNLSITMQEQSAKLEQLGATLAQSIDSLGQKQVERLDAMKSSIEQMQTSTAQAEKNSAELLAETKAYQQQALANDAAQMKILSDNTAQIVDMKNSFDKFLKDVANGFSQEFIRALNESIKDLNDKLQDQFGENFKELNSAVREVVIWQREYKDIITRTTEELKVINQTFNREVMSELKSSLKTFTETSAQNISVQNELYNATARLAKVVNQADASIVHMKTITETFDNFSEEVLKNNTALLQSHLNTLKQLEENLVTNVKKINSVAFDVAADTTQYLKDFNETSASSMQIIRDTISRYKTDLDKETESSLSKLHQLFETVAKNTDEQSGKAIKNLAFALAEVSGQMIDNYKTLVEKIAEVDKLLNGRRYGR